MIYALIGLSCFMLMVLALVLFSYEADLEEDEE